MTGSSLPLRADLGQVAGIFLERVVLVLGRRAVGGAALAQIGDRLVQALRRDAGVLQDARAFGARRHGEREQQIFRGDEAVAGLLRDLLGIVEQPRGFRRQVDLSLPDLRPCGSLASARSTLSRTCSGRPPAAAIRRAARPSSSSMRTFSRCSGVNCWWLERSASPWADCMNPRARSVNFSTSIWSSQARARPLEAARTSLREFRNGPAKAPFP